MVTRTHAEFSATDALAFVDQARSFGTAMVTRATELVNEVAQDKMSPDQARSALLGAIASAQQAEATNDGIRGGSAISMGDDAHDKFIRGATNALVQRAGMNVVRAGSTERGRRCCLPVVSIWFSRSR